MLTIKGMMLLVKVAGVACLYLANTQEMDAAGNPVVRFKAWTNRSGIDLYWMGRRVEKVYSAGPSAEVWYCVSIPDAARSLVDCGACIAVSSEPSLEGRLPT